MDQKIVIILIILFLMNCYCLFRKNDIEKMTDTTSSSDTPLQILIKDTVKKQMETGVKETINQIYKADIGAIRNLSTLSQKLQGIGEFKDSKGVTIPGNLIIKGNLSTAGNLTASGTFNYLPTGTILAYYKNIAPKGWAICDGKNGTPDLRGKFIYGYGAGSGSTFNKTGGSETHKLTVNEIPSHNHTTNTTGNHTHRHYYESIGGDNCDRDDEKRCNGSGKWRDTDAAGNHSHTITNTGGNGSHNNMPPYHVLSYIMKL